MYTYDITNKEVDYKENGKVTRTYTFAFEFKTKKEYLAFRKEWKLHYKELSKRIREAKHDLKNKMREQAASTYYAVWKEQGHVMSLRENACMMMQLVEAAKKEAGKQQEMERNLQLQEAS